MEKGLFITFEGIDGCGKTTQLDKIAEWLSQQNYSVVKTREPGGTEIGKQIRSTLLRPENQNLHAQSELLLYLADRIQHLHEVILPAKASGKIVLCDRFHDSTVAYQGYGRQLNLKGIESIVQEWVSPHFPDLTLYLSIPPQTALKRIVKRHTRENIFSKEGRIDAESLSFFQRVAHGYNQLLEQEPGRIIGIEGNKSIDEVYQEIQRIIKKRIRS